MNWTAHRVKRLRKRAGLTQQSFAGVLKVSEKTVRNWETGTFGPDQTSATKLNRLARRVGFLA